MSEAYRIKRFHHVTSAKHRRLRDEKLIPLLDHLANNHIIKEDMDSLLSSDEAMQMRMDEFDSLEKVLGVVQNILDGDWLVDCIDEAQPIYIMKFKRYSYQPHKHLFVKHFGVVSHVFKVEPNSLPTDLLIPILRASHLDTLPLSISKTLDKYEILALAMEEQEKENKDHIELLQATSKVKRGRPTMNGPVIIKKPASR